MTTNNSWNSENPAQVSRGGTGLSSTTAYAVICGGTTSTGDLQSIASVGSSSEVLTSNGAAALPTFQAAAGGGAWTFIESATASDDATVDFTDLTSTYFMYMVVFEDVVPATDTVEFYLRTSTDNGVTFDTGSSNYGYAGRSVFATSNTTIATSGDSQFRMISVSPTFGTNTNENAAGHIYIYNPTGATRTRFLSQNQYTSAASSNSMCYMGGMRRAAGDVDAIRFLMETGNIASGTFKLYGLVA